MIDTATRRDFFALCAALGAAAFVPTFRLPTRKPARLIIDVQDMGEQTVGHYTRWLIDNDDESVPDEASWVEYQARIHRLHGKLPCCGETVEAWSQVDNELLKWAKDEHAFLVREMTAQTEAMEAVASQPCSEHKL